LREITLADKEIDDIGNGQCQRRDVQNFGCCKASGAIVGEDFVAVDGYDFCEKLIFDLLGTTTR